MSLTAMQDTSRTAAFVRFSTGMNFAWLSFLFLLGKGQFDAGEIERRKDIRMRCIFEIRNQPKSQQRMKQE